MPIKRNLDNLISSSINNNVNGQQSQTNFDIEGLFKPVFDKQGKFEITMRFLPPVESEDSQYIENRDHWLKQLSGKNIAITCRKRFKNIGENKGWPCPICDYNNKMYEKFGDKKGEYAEHKLPSARPEYMCNILIIRNDNQPSTEGQVFRFKYSKKIKDIIDKAINGSGEFDENGEPVPPINPYSYYGLDDTEVLSGNVRPGANFVWRAEPGEYGPKYDNSSFNLPSRIGRCVEGTNSLGQVVKKIRPLTDEEIDAVEAKLYTLKEHEKSKEKCLGYDETIDYVQKKTGINLRPTLGITAKTAEQSFVETVSTNANFKEVDDFEIFNQPTAPASTESSLTPPPPPAPAYKAPAPTPAPAKPNVTVAKTEEDLFNDLFG